MRSQNSLLRAVLEHNPVGKRTLERSKLRWEDIVNRDVVELGGANKLEGFGKKKRRLEKWFSDGILAAG